MKHLLRSALAAAVIAVPTILVGCGDDGGTGPAAVSSVTVTALSTELEIGQTVQLDVVVRDASGNELTNRTVNYQSSAPAVAEVSDGGLVTALDEGTATITATSEGRSGEITITVLPPPVALVTVTPATANLTIDETVQLTATAEDIGGNELTSYTVTWTSDDDGVATVSNTGLVTAVSAGEAIISAEAGGVEGSATVTVAPASFNPQEDTELPAGVYDFATFDVPDGVTVTLLGDVEINVEEDATMNGAMEGDCTAMTLRGDAAMEVGGDIDISCQGNPDAEDPGALRIIASTDLTIGDGTFTTTGDVEMTNDESLTDDDFDDEALSRGPGPNQTAGGTCWVGARTFTPSPARRPDGADGEASGGDGDGGHNWVLRCQGDAVFTGGTVVEGQDGGHGGDAESDDDPNSDTANGGDGADGGKLKVQSTGDIDFDGTNGGTTLNLADGGDGGHADKHASAPGQSAEANGGDGGQAGSFEVRALGGITIDVGGLTIVVGEGGPGGNGTATGGDGMDAGASAATDGGDATATGGEGGGSPEGQLRATGNVAGAGNIDLTGGDAGAGGEADAWAGNGGDGNEDFPDGADGGNMSATGGAGGNSVVKDLDGFLIGFGGDGGDAYLAGGMGGQGWNDCEEDNLKPGGMGGDGGDGSGHGGKGGTGLLDGLDGDIYVAGGTGNGGDGGDGEGPGDGGMAGDDSGILSDPPAGNEMEARIDEGDNFEDGSDGSPCSVAEIEAEDISFVHVYAESPCPQEVGSYAITNNSDSDVTVEITSSHGQVSFQRTGGSIMAGGLETTIPAMTSIVVTVYFNCNSTDDFSADISITVTQNQSEVASEDVKVNGDIQGAPGAKPGEGGGER